MQMGKFRLKRLVIDICEAGVVLGSFPYHALVEKVRENVLNKASHFENVYRTLSDQMHSADGGENSCNRSRDPPTANQVVRFICWRQHSPLGIYIHRPWSLIGSFLPHRSVGTLGRFWPADPWTCIHFFPHEKWIEDLSRFELKIKSINGGASSKRTALIGIGLWTEAQIPASYLNDCEIADSGQEPLSKKLSSGRKSLNIITPLNSIHRTPNRIRNANTAMNLNCIPIRRWLKKGGKPTHRWKPTWDADLCVSDDDQPSHGCNTNWHQVWNVG